MEKGRCRKKGKDNIEEEIVRKNREIKKGRENGEDEEEACALEKRNKGKHRKNSRMEIN